MASSCRTVSIALKAPVVNQQQRRSQIETALAASSQNFARALTKKLRPGSGKPSVKV